MTVRYVWAFVLVLILAGVLFSAGCAQPDPQVMVTPYVAKAPAPPPPADGAATRAAGMQPGTRVYEETLIGQ